MLGNHKWRRSAICHCTCEKIAVLLHNWTVYGLPISFTRLWLIRKLMLEWVRMLTFVEFRTTLSADSVVWYLRYVNCFDYVYVAFIEFHTTISADTAPYLCLPIELVIWGKTAVSHTRYIYFRFMPPQRHLRCVGFNSHIRNNILP